ncbi:MAG: hypothetical protein ABIH85_02755 [Candidatus Omnitrophota bacterium]|nr:hypothetical protein [Candidatus Omnitrophota bacterium]MBU1894244.1 hypothetical protein [Candidatus Omnitrophota bacterium]
MITANWIKMFVVGAFFICGFIQNAESREKANLYKELSAKDEVKVYINKISDSAHAGKADEVSLKQKLEEALSARKSINFKIVSIPEESDITLKCDIVEFIWMEEDPIDEVHGIGPAVFDAIKKDNYVRMQIVFSVLDSKTNEELWHKKLKTTITKTKMDEEASIPLANEGIIKIFIRECFNKQRKVLVS